MNLRSPPALFSFRARVVRGAGRGRHIGSPTFNLQLSAVPRALQHGIYACTVRWNRKTFPAALHFGPRPVFRAGIACEVHVIGHRIRRAPKTIRIDAVKRLRAIRNFPSVAALQRQIVEDIHSARAILSPP
ncbi:MAG: riboflavin kinase [Candidatus Peribacteraceae bacterium]|nr:riboflavin kinase [Candidatus Peribacteraceae bacterium]